jgi:hypothetical protein
MKRHELGQIIKASLRDSFEVWKEFVMEIIYPSRSGITDWGKANIFEKCLYQIVCVPMLSMLAILFVFLFPPINLFYDIRDFHKKRNK